MTAVDSWWDDGSHSRAAVYFRERIDLDDENECNLCNGVKFAALRLLHEVRGMWLHGTKAEILEWAFDRVLEDPTWRPRPRDPFADRN